MPGNWKKKTFVQIIFQISTWKVLLFNSLSSEIQNASSTALFNSKLKSFFLGLSTL